MFVDLLTKRGEEILKSEDIPWQEYPRPQMRRDSFLNLNGDWEFAVRKNRFPSKYNRTIRLPFCPESILSGVGRHFSEGSALCYRRFVTLPEGFVRGRVLLHIGAADQIIQCFVNNKKVGEHFGGYEHICFDITDALTDGENEIRFRCFDDLNNHLHPYGKQVLPSKRGGMWYTPVSGIWQSVWLESVPQQYIQNLRIENCGSTVTIQIAPKLEGQLTVADLGTFPLKDGKVTIQPEKPHFWSPEDPHLYDFTLEAGDDRIESYFAIRSLEIKEVAGKKRLCLNGKPYFFHGLLDQGYWPDGLFTPATAGCYADDILAMKKLGFNTLRKHIKVEPDEFYYQCDKLGMIVFQDMVNNGDYNFFRDTALPTIGIQKLGDRNLHVDNNVRQAFLDGMEATVRQLWNFPCICYWTIFNEGWGQFDSDRVYEILRKLDDTRFIDSTSGWFRREKTDVDSHHVYFKKVRLKAEDKPLVLSEFGGYSYKMEGHSFNTDQTYGYGKFTDQQEYTAAVEKLYREQVLPTVKKGLCAAIYTQVSDVEDETNGLLTYDRRCCKLDEKTMCTVANSLQKALDE